MSTAAPRLLILVGLLLAAGSASAVTVEHWRTDNGARVYFVAAAQLPIVDVRVLFDAGSARDGDTPGLARLTSAVLQEGTTERDAQALHETLAELGARLSADTGRDQAWVGIRTLSAPERLAPAADLLAELLASPAIAPAVVARERDRQLVRLRERAQSLSARLDDRLWAAVYRGHPYATPVEGLPGRVADLDAGDVRAFHRRHYVAANAVVAIVGDLTRASARALAERVSAPLPRGEAPAPLPAPVPLAPEPIEIREARDTNQVHLGIGQPGVAVGDPDYYALYLANHVLGGGGFISRLFAEIRERRGLSYGAWSRLEPQRQPGLFSARLATRADQAGPALQALREVIERFVADGPTEQELQRSRRNIIGGFPLRLDSNAKQLEYIAFIGVHALELDYLDRFPERIAQVTRAQALAAVRRHIDPARMATVLIGALAPDTGE